MAVLVQPLFEGRLTTKALFALQPPVFLVSNRRYASGVPLICEWLPTTRHRLSFWKKVKRAELPGTLFRAFASLRDYLRWRLVLMETRSA